MEGDRDSRSRASAARNFYPRPHMEGDFGLTKVCPKELISTHALTWRATRHILQDCRDFVNFYPRPYMEGDLN